MTIYSAVNDPILTSEVATLVSKVEAFLQTHATTTESGPQNGEHPITSGAYALYPGRQDPDLYGMVDAVYILHIIGKLADRTNSSSRSVWASRILDCQDSEGWFSKRNLRGHSVEHATAYAIGALKLLEVEEGEEYVAQVGPLNALLPLLTDHTAFTDWIEHLGFRYRPGDILSKNLGWHYIWRSSHIGGGVAAALAMTRELHEKWWSGVVDSQQWFNWYFDWLDAKVNANTGFWQRAFWNYIYNKPTMIDMAGAVHFFWVYEALGQPFPFPEQVIESTIPLQRPDGLYKDHPFCIDLDGNFCIIRSYLQLPSHKQQQYEKQVMAAVERNFFGVLDYLNGQPLQEIYSDLHGLPGALAALVEALKLPDFSHRSVLDGWQNSFDVVCWI